MAMLLVIVGAWAVAQPAGAQSPAPTGAYMEDVYPGHNPVSGSYAVIVEGLGGLKCTYSQASIEEYTIKWVNENLKTVTEISPQSVCGSISAYESMLSSIKGYLYRHFTNNTGAGTNNYWGGFMLDEEPGFGFSASQLETLNGYVETLMSGAGADTWYFQEDQPNGWGTSVYNAILKNSWPAPQAYTSSMVNAINAECTTYKKCTNLVTIDSRAASPWNSASWVTSQVHGAAWSLPGWNQNHLATTYWDNIWQPG